MNNTTKDAPLRRSNKRVIASRGSVGWPRCARHNQPIAPGGERCNYCLAENKGKLTPEVMREALNTLRLARKESSQAFLRASYHAPVQPVFDILDREEGEQ